MALQGSHNFKGIELSEAYLQVTNFTYALNSSLNTVITTPAVMEADGVTIATEAVYSDVWVKQQISECLVKVFKDKATRDADPFSNIEEFNFKLQLSIASGAVNPIEQAYVALKADSRYEDHTDV
jgi:hypothetical protein|tara:strand:- start:247 stop:621 length:375 start_codon:yes stop_codon:yes gene_type:complete